HVGRKPANRASSTARTAHCVLQRTRHRHDGAGARCDGAGVHLGAKAAFVIRGGAALSHAHVVPYIRRSQQPGIGRQIGLRPRPCAHAGVCACPIRPCVADRRCACRHRCVCGESVAGKQLSASLRELGPYLALVLVGFLPNEIWRLFGIVVARRIDEGSKLLVWVRAVATAVLAGIIAQLILTPPGALAGVALAVRLAAVVAGFAVFLMVRRSVFVGVVAGEIALVLGTLIWG